jgi:hypothetical protein
MKKTILTIGLCITAMLGIQAQNDYAGNYTRSLSDVMKDVEQRFGVRFKYNVDTAGVKLTFADWRIRPYSLEETLTNICQHFDWNWWKQNDNLYKIKPYEYPRRHTEEGAKMLAYLNTLYADRASWEARRDTLRQEVRQRLGIDAFLDSCVQNAKPILSKVLKHDGYTTQNICIELTPGQHVFGTIYTPLRGKKQGARSKASSLHPPFGRAGVGSLEGPFPLIICPDGHWVTRSRDDEQKRLGTLARMGAICVDFDLYGYGQSEAEVGREAHRTARAHVYQVACALKLLDYMWNNRKDVDKTRIGVNGGSGGGSHTILLTAIDPRFTAAAPTVNLASHFDGGCPCESGMPIQKSAGGTCNPELLAMFAPHPVQVVSDGGDWTASVPTLEYPYLQRIWNFYGASEKVENVHLPNERHDYGPSKRHANYDFFIRVFGLDRTMLDESKVEILPLEKLESQLKR